MIDEFLYMIVITAINSSADGVLQIMMSPQDNEKTFERDTSMLMFFEIDSRSGIVEGQSTMVNGEQLLVCEVTYIGTSSSVPTFQWIKNGEIINKDVNSNADESAIDMTSTLVISNFGQSEVGVYQCIVTDDDTDAEVIMTQPYRLDTGNLVYLLYLQCKCMHIVFVLIVQTYKHHLVVHK